MRSSQKIPWRINHQIRAQEVRLIAEDGKQIGVLKMAEALAKSQETSLDLIEIAPNANPPVVKLANLGKFLYQEEKRKKKEERGQKGGDIKELRFSPFIGEADYQTRLKRVKEFLDEKNKVRLVVIFTTRQLGSKQFGYDLIARVVREGGEGISVDMEPKFLGKRLIAVISGGSRKIKNAETEN